MRRAEEGVADRHPRNLAAYIVEVYIRLVIDLADNPMVIIEVATLPRLKHDDYLSVFKL